MCSRSPLRTLPEKWCLVIARLYLRIQPSVHSPYGSLIDELETSGDDESDVLGGESNEEDDECMYIENCGVVEQESPSLGQDR